MDATKLFAEDHRVQMVGALAAVDRVILEAEQAQPASLGNNSWAGKPPIRSQASTPGLISRSRTSRSVRRKSLYSSVNGMCHLPAYSQMSTTPLDTVTPHDDCADPVFSSACT